MARAAGRGLGIDLRPAIEEVGLDEVIRQIGLERLVEVAGVKEVIKHVGVKRVIDELLSQLTPAQRRELKRRLQ